MAECILSKSGGGIGSDEVTVGKAQVLAGYTALTKDSNDEPVAGTMTDFTKVLNKIQNKRITNGRFEVAVDRGFHNCNWAEGSYEYMELAEVASALGLTAAKLLKGQTVCGVAGSATSDANATAAYIYNGKTAYVNGQKVTGAMTVASVVSFSVAPYSTSQVIATWKNPSRGPYGTFCICGKKGSYPTSSGDSRLYTGAGNNVALNATNSVTIGGLEAGQTYYFRIWTSVNTSAGWIESASYMQTTCTPTAHGRAAFTSSGTWMVPAGVRSINIHCTGGGGGGWECDYEHSSHTGGTGGGGGYTAYKNSISVSPGQQVICNVGAGSYGRSYESSISTNIAGASSATISGSVIVSAKGANQSKEGVANAYAYNHSGGSAGGFRGFVRSFKDYTAPEAGASDGENKTQGTGQGITTREFGTGALYGGGGGGGGCDIYFSGSEEHYGFSGAVGGAGGGGNGGGANGIFGIKNPEFQATPGANGSAGTGGGGGGGSIHSNQGIRGNGGDGGSGNVIITW